MYELEVSREKLRVRTDNERVIEKFRKNYPQHDEVGYEDGLFILDVYARAGYEFTPFTEEG
jgi:hypothetical protein